MPAPSPTLSRLLLPAAVALAVVQAHSGAQASWWNPWSRPKPEEAPNLRGDKVRVVFRGNTLFAERKLRAAIDEQLARIRSEGLSRPIADDAAYYTAVFYHQNGYASAEVAWDIHGEELLLTITEGRLIQLRSSGITGNRSIPSARLIARLNSVTSTRLGLSEAHLPFVLDDLQMGVSRIVELYQSEGFLDVQVTGPEVEYAEDGTSAAVLVTVEEGPRYRFGKVQFKGDPVYAQDTLLKALAPLLSQPYTPARQVALQSALLQFYAEHAYFDAVAEVEGDPATATPDGSIPLTITVHPGATYIVRGIDAHGLARLRLDWLRNRLAPLLEQPYHPDKLARKQNELMGSGLFDSLKITPQPQADRTLLLQIDAREAKARDLGFSLGYGGYEGLMGSVRFSDRNLFGRALPASAELNLSQRAIALETTLANPWLFETRTEFVSRAFIRSRLELGYDKREAGVRAELSRRIFPPVQLAAFGQIRTVDISSSKIPQELLGVTKYQVATAGVSLIWDKRNSALNPTSGWIASFLADTNTLSQGNTFARTSGRLTWHYPLPARMRFAASARFGFLPQRSTVPIDERYFLGGASTVRSFNERELGVPKHQSYPTGGSAYSLLNAETDFPVWNALRGAVFFDAGSLSERGGTIPTDQFRSALGLGLRYALPVGPVRLDIGFNPDRKPNEDWGAVHLSFGFAF